MKKIHILLVLLLSIFHFSCKNEKLDSSIIKIKASKAENQNKLLVDSTGIEQSEWLEVENKSNTYSFPCSEWKRKIILNNSKITLDLMESSDYDVSKIEKTNTGFNVHIKNVEWYYKFKWIDKEKGISKWEYIYNGKIDKSFSYFTVKNLQSNISSLTKVDCFDSKKKLDKFNLDGNWAYNEESSYASLKIEKNQGLFVVMSNQIYINVKINNNNLNKNSYNVFFDTTNDLGAGGMNMNWNNFSKDKPIAVIKELIDNKIEFNWIGFYNNKSKLIEFKECEFNLQSSSNPVVLQKL